MQPRTTTTQIPPGFSEVTTAEFFRRLYADPRDIMPSIVNKVYPYESIWKTRDGKVFGWSRCAEFVLAPETYALKDMQ